MKVAILQEELEWTEKELVKILTNKDIQVQCFDVRDMSLDDILSSHPDILLNRVYASVGNRNYQALGKTLSILKGLERHSIKTINSYQATKADYSKFHAFQLMQQANIPTPNTILHQDSSYLLEEVEKLNGYPIIIKRDSGGRGMDLARCASPEEAKSALSRISNSDDYNGGIILQEFVEPIEPRDYRVCVINGEVIYHHGRSLITLEDSEKPWLASRSLGSEILPIDVNVPEDLRDFSIKAAASIGAFFNVLDIIKTNQGYLVIEHNPTPNFRPEYEGILGYNPVEYVIDKILHTAESKHPSTTPQANLLSA